MSAEDFFKRKIKITTQARFHAHKRLRAHGWCSQWALAILAVGQIVISLLPVLDVPLAYTNDYMAFGSIFFGTLVLAYSLLLGISDFNSRSVLFHECGLELNRLYQNFLFSEKKEPISELIQKYNDILGKYENHTEVDHLFAMRNTLPPNENAHGWRKTKAANPAFLLWTFEFYLRNFWQFSHYVLSVIMMGLWIFFAVYKPDQGLGYGSQYIYIMQNLCID